MENMKIIAYIHNDFTGKFGIPRQSGLVPEMQSVISFVPEFRSREAVRGLEDFSHIWLIWKFSETVSEEFSPTVRPPRLGGNTRMGVFATRSPYRPNPIGLSVVELSEIEFTKKQGPLLFVRGADLMDGTPIYDIKPYLPHIDSHPEATGGFSSPFAEYRIPVDFPELLLRKIPSEKQKALLEILAQDPRPSYQEDPNRVYKMSYAQIEIGFTVSEAVLHVVEVTETGA